MHWRFHRLAALVVVVSTAIGGELSAQEMQSQRWNRRWRFAEERVTEADLTRMGVALTPKLVVLSEPFASSYSCTEGSRVQGSVTAIRRSNGAFRWRAKMPQDTEHQGAFLDVYVWGEAIVFATNDTMTSFDAKGRRRWQSHLRNAPKQCGAAPVHSRFRWDVAQYGRYLIWQRGNSLCVFDLKRGKTKVEPWRDPAQRFAGVKRRGRTDFNALPKLKKGRYLIGYATDDAGAVKVVANCPKTASDCTVRVSYHEK